ncbi:hypothetical protein FOCC_FOCC000149, partial [Frankliniella occidentalis]
MPAGLKDAASRWQRTIEEILEPVTRDDPHCTIYMDDILAWSEDGDWAHHDPLKWVQVLPKGKRRDLLHQSHDDPTSGHGGFYRTFERVRRAGYWPGMKQEVKEYVEKCATCQRVKMDRSRRPGLMGSSRVVSAPMEVVTLDLVGPFPRSSKGFTYLHVITDVFSKYVV